MAVKLGQDVIFKINHMQLEGENPHMRVTIFELEGWENYLSEKQAERQNTPKRNSSSPEKLIHSLPETGRKSKRNQSQTEEQMKEFNMTLPLSQFKKTLKVHSTPIPGVSTQSPSKDKKRNPDLDSDQQIDILMEMTKKSLQEPPNKRRKVLTHKKSHNEDNAASSSSSEEEAPSKKESPKKSKEPKSQNGRSVAEKATKSVSNKPEDSDSSSEDENEAALPIKLKNTLEKIVLSQEGSPKKLSASPTKRHSSPEKESKLKTKEASPEKILSQQKKISFSKRDASPEEITLVQPVLAENKEEAKKEKLVAKNSKPAKRHKAVSPLRTAQNGVPIDFDDDEGLAKLGALSNTMFANFKLPSFEDDKPADKTSKKKTVKVDKVKESETKKGKDDDSDKEDPNEKQKPESKKETKEKQKTAGKMKESKEKQKSESKKEEPDEKQKTESKKEKSKKKESAKEKEKNKKDVEKPESKKKSKKSRKGKDTGTDAIISKLLDAAKDDKSDKKKSKKEKHHDGKSEKKRVDLSDLNDLAKMLLKKQMKELK